MCENILKIEVSLYLWNYATPNMVGKRNRTKSYPHIM